MRNVRYLAIAQGSHTYGHWRELDEVPAKLLGEPETFFVSYNAQRGIEYKPGSRCGRRDALILVREGARTARPR